MPIQPPIRYDCSKCPGYCCSYPRIEVKDRDLARLAHFFSLSPQEAERRFTRRYRDDAVDERILRLTTDALVTRRGYLKILAEKYRMIEKRLPIFASSTARKGRYFVRDNFLRAWLDALGPAVAAINFRPIAHLVAQADERLQDAEGFGLERLVATLYEERSRKALGDFSLSRRIEGYWDRSDTEIDLVAIDEASGRIRFGTCKRSPDKLERSMKVTDGHIARFLDAHPTYGHWTIERVAIAPRLDDVLRSSLRRGGYLAQDLADLTEGLDRT